MILLPVVKQKKCIYNKNLYKRTVGKKICSNIQSQFFPSSITEVQLKFSEKTEMVWGEYVIGKAIHWPQDILRQKRKRPDEFQAIVQKASTS